MVILKSGSRSQNSDQICSYPHNKIHETWSECINWFKRYGADKLLWVKNYIQSAFVTLTMRPRSPKSNNRSLVPNGVSRQVWLKSIGPEKKCRQGSFLQS